jgi:hypothetical protein
MEKLIEKFKANPKEANRLRLQAYLNKHPMAITCSPHYGAWLRENGFSI